MARTWFGRSIVIPRRRLGVDVVPGRRLRGVGLAIEGLDTHPPHQRRDTAAADLGSLLVQEVPQHPAACERKLEVRLVRSAHDGEGGGRHRSGPVMDAAPADPERLRLLDDRRIMVAVDHRFALGRPALPSAPDKKSSVSVSSPILAWSVFTSTADDAALGSEPNTPAAPSRS